VSRGQSTDPRGRSLGFPDRSRYLLFQVTLLVVPVAIHGVSILARKFLNSRQLQIRPLQVPFASLPVHLVHRFTV
jgi:hypothetical protein